MTLGPLEQKSEESVLLMAENSLALMIPAQKKGNSGAGGSQSMLLNVLKVFINPVPSLWPAGATPLGVAALLLSSYMVNRHTLSRSGAPTADQVRVNRPVLIQGP